MSKAGWELKDFLQPYDLDMKHETANKLSTITGIEPGEHPEHVPLR